MLLFILFGEVDYHIQLYVSCSALIYYLVYEILTCIMSLYVFKLFFEIIGLRGRVCYCSL